MKKVVDFFDGFLYSRESTIKTFLKWFTNK